VLLVGGLILGIIAAAGWLLDAGQEYHSTEQVGHAIPRTRDPRAVWPRRLVPLFGAVIVLSFLGMLAPTGISWLNSLTPPEATPTPVAVPAVPQISASSLVSFDTKLLIVPAGRPFDLVFDNRQAGVPHNVEIDDSPARTRVIFDGAVITGPAQVTYRVPALAAGDYYFLCRIHPNMNGTLRALPESGSAAGGSPTP
jgi:plastocyanin